MFSLPKDQSKYTKLFLNRSQNRQTILWNGIQDSHSIWSPHPKRWGSDLGANWLCARFHVGYGNKRDSVSLKKKPLKETILRHFPYQPKAETGKNIYKFTKVKNRISVGGIAMYKWYVTILRELPQFQRSGAFLCFLGDLSNKCKEYE